VGYQRPGSAVARGQGRNCRASSLGIDSFIEIEKGVAVTPTNFKVLCNNSLQPRCAKRHHQPHNHLARWASATQILNPWSPVPNPRPQPPRPPPPTPHTSKPPASATTSTASPTRGRSISG